MRVWQYTKLEVDGVGGVETHILAVSRELEKLGHDVHIGLNLSESWMSANSQPMIIHTHGDTWPNLKLLQKIRRNASTLWIPVCHGTSIGRVLACKEFLSFSGWRGTLRDFLPTRLASAAVVVSEQALHEARTYFKMRLPARIIPNGADTCTFLPLTKIEDTPRLIFLGRGEDRVKNTSMLLAACKTLYTDHPDLTLVAAPGLNASGAEFPFLKNTGPLKGATLANTMAKCRALVLCSLYEGDPVVLHEAKAMGLPVVASDLPQLRQNLRGYQNALFINPHSLESLTSSLSKILLSTSELKPAPIRRDWSTVASEFSDFYHSLLK